MNITDSVMLGDGKLSDEGYLVVNARTARVGVQQYLGSEVGKPEMSVVNVYRDEKEVFSKKSLDTFSRIPITNDHPRNGVDATNWRDLAVGTTGDDVLRDGEYLKIGLKITDADAVRAVKDGKRELSVGYSTQLVWEDGVAADGTAYQARQVGIVANHIAIVDAGRAGPLARISDSAAWGASPLTEDNGLAPITPKKETPMELKHVVLGDSAVQVAVTDLAAVEKFRDASAKALADAIARHDAAMAAKDAETAKKDAEIDALKGKVLDSAALDAAVAARGDLIAKAKAIHADVKTDGLSDAAIRKAVVVAKLGDAVKDKAEAYIDARFDILAEDAVAVDPVRNAIHTLQPVNDHGKAQASYVDRMTSRKA